MRKIAAVGLFLALTFTATAEPAQDFVWPSSPTKVFVNNLEISCAWRDGKPWALGTDIGKLLKLQLPDTSVNLAEVLADQHYDIRLSKSGAVEARNPNASIYKSWMDDPRAQAAQRAKDAADARKPIPPTAEELKRRKAVDDATANYEREKRKLEKMERVKLDEP